MILLKAKMISFLCNETIFFSCSFSRHQLLYLLVLPDVPRQLSISNIKSRSAIINWNAADDYLESRLEKYVIQVSNGSYTMRINVTSGIKWKNHTYRLQNLTEYTSYNVSIAAESTVAISDFTEEVTLLTLCGYINTSYTILGFLL